MITIKNKHGLIADDLELLSNYIREYNNVKRYAYNRKIKDDIKSQSEIEEIVKSNMENINYLDSSWIKCAVSDAIDIDDILRDDIFNPVKDSNGNYIKRKIYFGGKKNFFNRKFNKTNTFNKDKSIEMLGSKTDSNGDRKAELHKDKLILKLNKNSKLEIPLKLSRKQQDLIDILSIETQNNNDYFNFSINNEYICISINEPELVKHSFINDRYMGIDSNPNYIAFVIKDINKSIIHKDIFNLTELNKNKNTNKKKYRYTCRYQKHTW